jgi:hypothetical protein
MAREGPAGAFKYEVIAKDGEDLLYVYLPKDVASRQGTHTLLLCRWWCSSAQKRPVAAKGLCRMTGLHLLLIIAVRSLRMTSTARNRANSSSTLTRLKGSMWAAQRCQVSRGFASKCFQAERTGYGSVMMEPAIFRGSHTLLQGCPTPVVGAVLQASSCRTRCKPSSTGSREGTPSSECTGSEQTGRKTGSWCGEPWGGSWFVPTAVHPMQCCIRSCSHSSVVLSGSHTSAVGDHTCADASLLPFSCSLLKAGKAGSTDEDRDSTAPQDVDQEEHYSDASSSGKA